MRKISLSFALVLVGMITLFMTSCDRTEVISETTPAIEKTLRYAQDFTIYDRTGENSVTLQLESDNQALISNYMNEGYELVPLFEMPKQSRSANSTVTDLGIAEEINYAEVVEVSVKAKNLVAGVVGYQITKKSFDANGNERACSGNYAVYKSQRDRVDITVTNGTTGKVRVARKSGAVWITILSDCASAGAVMNNVGWTGSPQIRVKISQALGYTLNFHN